MKSVLSSALLILLFACNSFGQSCNCPQEFNFIKEKVEKNYAGFKDKVNDKTKAKYDKWTQSVLEHSKSISTSAHCLYLINDWLTFFRDGHLQVGRNRISKEKEESFIKERIHGIENLKLSDEDLAGLRNKKGIEGIYWDKNLTSCIAVISNKTSFRDYAGVVISSNAGKWMPGQVVLELKKSKHTLKGVLYDRYYIPENVSFPLKQDALGPFKREGSDRSSVESSSGATVASKLLSSKTLYIKISTFNQANARNIDSVFKANQSILNKMPYLILDLRNNGGGADFSYRAITPYLYTKPLKLIGADVLATDDNIAGWAAIATTNGIPADQKIFITNVIQMMKQHIGKLVSFSEDRDITFDSVLPYPKKIIILINKDCGSTTEEFLLMAKQSDKVVLMGEHTAGVLDYANMRGADFYGMPYMLYWATSRSRRIDKGLTIDNVGIRPDKYLTHEQDWIDEAKDFVESNVK